MKLPPLILQSLLVLLNVLGIVSPNAVRATPHEPRFKQLQTQFFILKNLTDEQSSGRQIALWNERMMNLDLSKTFPQTNTNGFAMSVTKVHYHHDLAFFEFPNFSHASAQQILFPNIFYSHCSSESCDALQKVGPLLPDAQYQSHYRLIRIQDEMEFEALQPPKELLLLKAGYPKYILLQLATDWSQYFNRASSVITFEPAPEENWVVIRSIQTMSLNKVGAMGKSVIKAQIDEQIQTFLNAFGKL